MLRVVNLTRDRVLAERALRATAFFERLRGLLGLRQWDDLDGLWIEPCSGVHSFGMRMAVDVVTVDGAHEVVGAQTLRPWRLGRIHLDAVAALEVPAGTVTRTGTRPGDLLLLEEMTVGNSGAGAGAGGGAGSEPSGGRLARG